MKKTYKVTTKQFEELKNFGPVRSAYLLYVPLSLIALPAFYFASATEVSMFNQWVCYGSFFLVIFMTLTVLQKKKATKGFIIFLAVYGLLMPSIFSYISAAVYVSFFIYFCLSKRAAFHYRYAYFVTTDDVKPPEEPLPVNKSERETNRKNELLRAYFGGNDPLDLEKETAGNTDTEQ